MGQTFTTRVKAIKNDDAETVLVSEINGAFDKLDNNFTPAAKMRSSGAQSITNSSSVKIAYDQTVFDSFAARSEGAMADLSNDQINIRIAGLYLITASVVFVSNITGYRSVGIRKGATLIKRVSTDGNTQNSIDTSMTVSDPIVCAANDIISAVALQTSGAALNIDPSFGGALDAIALSAVWLGSVVEV